MNSVRISIAFMALTFTTVQFTNASCNPTGCTVGPCVALDLIVDPSFNNDCPDWQWTGATREYSQECGKPWPGPTATWVAELDKFGVQYQNVISQTITLPSEPWSEEPFEFDMNWKVTGENAGNWDRLRVNVYDVQTGAFIERVGSWSGNTAPTSCTRFTKFLNKDYYSPGQAIRMSIEAQVVSSGTAFYVDKVSLWNYF